MKREILFRGKSIFKNEWWEGFYIYSDYEKKHFIVQNAIDNQAPNGSISFSHFAEIDVKTLGQFTGLKDKNGTDIYEGDILKGKYNNWIVLGLGFCDGFFGITLKTTTMDKIYLADKSFENSSEVVGNIFENPELKMGLF